MISPWPQRVLCSGYPSFSNFGIHGRNLGAKSLGIHAEVAIIHMPTRVKGTILLYVNFGSALLVKGKVTFTLRLILVK